MTKLLTKAQYWYKDNVSIPTIQLIMVAILSISAVNIFNNVNSAKSTQTEVASGKVLKIANIKRNVSISQYDKPSYNVAADVIMSDGQTYKNITNFPVDSKSNTNTYEQVKSLSEQPITTPMYILKDKKDNSMALTTQKVHKLSMAKAIIYSLITALVAGFILNFLVSVKNLKLSA